MNARFSWPSAACISVLLAAAWLALSPGSARAFDILQTVPDIIHSGVVLPGDASVIACPVQQDFSAPLALSDAIDIALCNPPQARAAWANIKLQAAALGEARAAYFPKISGSAGRLANSTRSSFGNIENSTSVKGNILSA